MMKNILVICALITLASCSVAPINTTTTARPLGKDKNQLTANAVATGAQYARGITEKLDLNIGLESQFGLVLNAYAKYNLKDSAEKGFSVATIAGGGYGSDLGHSKSLYAGVVFSYRNDNIEPFLTTRFNYVHWRISELTSDDRDNLITIPSYKATFYYGQADFGLNFINDNMTVALGGRVFIFPDSTSMAPFGDIAFRF